MPAGAGVVRRTGSSGSGKRRLREHRRTAASSSAVIVAKSLRLQDLARREGERGVERRSRRRPVPPFDAGGGSIACARRAGSSGAGSRSPPRADARVGSSAAIIFSRSCGLRQKRSNACSKSGEVLVPRDEHRGERLAEVVAVRKPDRFDRRERVDHLRRTDRQPGARSTRTKCRTFSARRPFGAKAIAPGSCAVAIPARIVTAGCPPVCDLGDDPRRDLGLERADVVLVLEQHAQRVGHRLRIERDAVERDQRLGPVERLGDARRLEQVHRAQPLRERDDLARERFGAPAGTCGARSRARAARRDSRPSGRGSGA